MTRTHDTSLMLRNTFALGALLSATHVAAALPPIDLEDVTAGDGGFVINGIDAGDESGSAIALIGDMNGDGLGEIVVGARRSDVGANVEAGEAFVVFGKADTAPVELSDLDAGIGGFAIRGTNTLDRFGATINDAGDVNGDGLADVIIGAWNADSGGAGDNGRCYVIFGKADTAPLLASDIAAGGVGAGGFVINGINSSDNLGREVACAGDLNGDGMDDLLLGADGGDPGGSSGAGETYVVYGKADTTPVEASDIAAGNGGFVINGIDASDRSGVGIASLGDMNGDGIGDLAIGAFSADSLTGEAYVIFGQSTPGTIELSDVALGIGGFLITGAGPGDQLGANVAGVGDMNGDGTPDVAVSATAADFPGVSNAGQTYVIFGKPDTAPVDVSLIAASPAIGGFAINGSGNFDGTGQSVEAAGDVNDDGLADVIVSGSFYSNFGSNTGGTFVVYGKPDTTAVELSDVTAGSGGYLIYGADTFDQSGSASSGKHDVNGDGRLDIATGAPFADPGGNSSAGASYVVFGLPPCAEYDLDGSGSIGFADLNAVLTAWGPCPGCPEDLDGNGVVGFADLDMLLAAWGPCP